jgi:hypothetical protein
VAPNYELGPARSQGLVDILDRILDKGLVVAGDIRIGLANVELLTIRIRLLVCSVDKANEIGMNWWRTDPHFSTGTEPVPQLNSVNEKLDRIAARLDALEQQRVAAPAKSGSSQRKER